VDPCECIIVNICLCMCDCVSVIEKLIEKAGRNKMGKENEKRKRKGDGRGWTADGNSCIHICTGC
jgi:hypothetical protein